MTDHVIALVALIIGIVGTTFNAIATAWAIIRHCRTDDEKRGEDRARMLAIEQIQRRQQQ